MNKSASKIKMNSRFDEMFASAATVKGDKRQIGIKHSTISDSGKESENAQPRRDVY